jgi:hypothetical protein
MPDIDEPLPLPENPQTVAELLPHLPIPYDYGRQYGMVFGQELADRLAVVQAENPTQHVASPVQMTDGRFLSVCRSVVGGAQRIVWAELHPPGCQPV